MSKLRQSVIPYLWTTPIVVLSGIKVYSDSRLNSCDGIIQGLGMLFLLSILTVLSITFLSRQVYKIIQDTENRKSRIRSCLVVVVAVSLAVQGKSQWKKLRLGNSILNAAISSDQLDIGQLQLLDNERYYAVYGHIDWSCTYTNHYRIKGDTLILDGQPAKKTDGILTDSYLITDSVLTPLNYQERAKTMKIEKIKYY